MDAFSNPVSTQESQMEVQEASAASHSVSHVAIKQFFILSFKLIYIYRSVISLKEPEDKVVSRMHLSEKERDGKAK